ncbi:hypothetical protein DFH27DRAFT_575922 [Peziza echinospora]|nr:hypothetical protein DFH27DRAFT_575922 [Peziza echinospora]
MIYVCILLGQTPRNLQFRTHPVTLGRFCRCRMEDVENQRQRNVFVRNDASRGARGGRRAARGFGIWKWMLDRGPDEDSTGQQRLVEKGSWKAPEAVWLYVSMLACPLRRVSVAVEEQEGEAEEEGREEDREEGTKKIKYKKKGSCLACCTGGIGMQVPNSGCKMRYVHQEARASQAVSMMPCCCTAWVLVLYWRSEAVGGRAASKRVCLSASDGCRVCWGYWGSGVCGAFLFSGRGGDLDSLAAAIKLL